MCIAGLLLLTINMEIVRSIKTPIKSLALMASYIRKGVLTSPIFRRLKQRYCNRATK